MRSRKTLLLALLCVFALSLLSANQGYTQEKPKDYPVRPIEVIVGAGPGGGSDIYARTICMMARNELKNPLVVINKPGGGGAIAGEYIVSKPADGYSLFAGTLLALVESPLLGLVGYQYADWQPVLRSQHDTIMLIGLHDGKFKDIQAVIADAKARPDQQTWGVVGTATGFNAICAREFTDALGIKVKLVPFDRTGKQHASLLGGHVDLILEEPGPISELLEAKKVRALLVFAENRIQDFSDVPTTKEMGAEAYMGLSRGIAIKAGTPRPIVDYLHHVFKKAMDTGFYKKYERSEWLHLRPGYLGPEDLDKFLRKEIEVYAREFKKFGVYKPKR